MPAEEGIRTLTAARNRELLFDATVEFLTGLLICVVTFSVIFLVARLVTWLYRWPGYVPMVVTGVLIVVAFVSAWRRVDPLADRRLLTEGEELLTLISRSMAHMLYFSPRHPVAGVSRFLLCGPTKVLSSLGTMLHRLPTGPALFRDAAAALHLAADGLPVESVENPLAVLLLIRLSLVKSVAQSDPGKVEVVATGKGRDLFGGESPFES